jgi:hypothetical protein
VRKGRKTERFQTQGRRKHFQTQVGLCLNDIFLLVTGERGVGSGVRVKKKKRCLGRKLDITQFICS